MDSSMVKGIVIGGIAMVVLGAGAVGTRPSPSRSSLTSWRSRKRSRDPTPREKCEEVQVQKQAPVKDEHRSAAR